MYPIWSKHRENVAHLEGYRISLLSKLALRTDEPPEVGWCRDRPRYDTATHRRLSREWILQHVQPAAQAVSADGIPDAGEADLRGAPRPGLHVLGAVRRHALLPARPRPFPARDLRRAAQQ